MSSVTREEIAKTLEVMRPHRAKNEMAVLTHFMESIIALENKCKIPKEDYDAYRANQHAPKIVNDAMDPDPDTTSFVYTTKFDKENSCWLTTVDVGDGKKFTTMGLTEISAFHNLMLLL